MRPNLKTWTCGRCERTILVPPMGEDGYTDTIMRIREHRFGHLTDALMHGSDEDLWGLAGEDSKPEWYEDDQGVSRPRNEPAGQSADACLSQLGNLASCALGPPVDSDDVAPVLVGIAQLLRDDLPRARKFQYPINEDGGFNR